MMKLTTNKALTRNQKLANTYQIRRTLSISELSMIYVARHMEKGTLHVIKEFFPAALVMRSKDRRTVYCTESQLQFKYDRMLESFRQEGQILQEIDHPGIVRYEDGFEENGTSYLVLEYYKGITLDRYIRDNMNQVDVEFLQQRLLPVIEALEYIHSLGYIHRDIKPGNILLADNGETRLLDFGSAVSYNKKTYEILTTAGYSPIEFYSGRSAQGPVSDIYSLAATFYFCCQGKAPIDVPKRLFQDDLEKLGANQPVSPILSRIIHWGLAVSADKRCTSLKWFKIAVQAERFWKRNLVLIRRNKNTTYYKSENTRSVHHVNRKPSMISNTDQKEALDADQTNYSVKS